MNGCEVLFYAVSLIVVWSIGGYVIWTEINRD